MGCGPSYSSASYNEAYKNRGYGHKSEHELFENTRSAASKTQASSFNTKARVSNTDVRPEMLNVGVRESRDTEDHKFKTPIVIAFDVTGSMSRRPEEMIKDQFPKLMDKLLQMGVRDPELLFLAIGDHECDEYPLQAGQFEITTDKILDCIQDFYLEKGGGGNGGESYLLAWIMAGYHTETDSWYKHHRKGFLFTLGDEPNLNVVPGEDLEKFLGYERGAKEITAQEALQKAQEQYEVFHIHITNANHTTSQVERGWRGLVGDHFLTASSTEVANVIADTISEHYIPVDESVINSEVIEMEETPKENITPKEEEKEPPLRVL